MNDTYIKLKDILKGFPYIVQTDIIAMLGSSDTDVELVKEYQKFEYYDKIKKYISQVMALRKDFIKAKEENIEEYYKFYNSFTIKIENGRIRL